MQNKALYVDAFSVQREKIGSLGQSPWSEQGSLPYSAPAAFEGGGGPAPCRGSSLEQTVEPTQFRL